MERFILEIPDAISKETCKELIEAFEASEHVATSKLENQTTGKSQVARDVRDCDELTFSGKPELAQLDKVLYDSLISGFNTYTEKILIPDQNHLPYNQFSSVHFQMMRYPPGSGGYKFHIDELTIKGVGTRTLSFIWYLNDLPVDHGTDFRAVDRTVKPEAGKLLIFPSGWCWQHRGLPTKQTKYIVTSWLMGALVHS